MTKEFKKIADKSETRYVLESMTAGATGSASIAAAPGRLGKLQKRLQELKDKVPQKPRQGPLRPQTGAGVHKNKKKDQQRGLEKHKGQSVYQEEFNGEYDDEAGMAESNLHTLARAVKGLIDTIDSNDNLPEWCQEKIAKAEMMLVSVWDYLQSQKEQGIDPEQGVAEGSFDESPENEMLQGRIGSVLIKLYDKGYTEEKIRMMQDRIATHLGYDPSDKQFQSAFNAALTSPEQGVAEGERTMSRAAKGNEKYGKDGMKALAKAGRDGASEKKLDSIRNKYDNYNEGLRDPEDNPCWKGYKPVGTKKKGGRTVPNCVPKESIEDIYTEHLLSQLQEKFASQQQAKLMYAVAGDRDVAKKTGVSTATAREFIKKSHGQQVKDLPKKVKKK